MSNDIAKPALPFSHLVVEGNIGAGKTTLCKLLAERYQCRTILEQFADNPFLPLFYGDRDRYAFMVELYFMMERHAQLSSLDAQPSLFNEPILSDYIFLKTLLFARKNLRANELELFRKVFVQLNRGLPYPELLVFLYRPIPVLLENIRRRARDYEAKITADYLNMVQRTYWDYLNEEKQFPILLINLGEADFEADPAVFEKMLSMMQQPLKKGLSIQELS